MGILDRDFARCLSRRLGNVKPITRDSVERVIWALVFPYLPLRYPATVNSWKLTPAHELASSEIVDGGCNSLVGLLRLYGLDGATRGTGALAHPVGRPIGSEFDPADIPALRLAVTAAMLDQNPSPLMPEEERSGNEGQRSTTSDNGLAWGHRIADDGYVAAEYGFMIPTLSGGYNTLQSTSLSLRSLWNSYDLSVRQTSTRTTPARCTARSQMARTKGAVCAARSTGSISPGVTQSQ